MKNLGMPTSEDESSKAALELLRRAIQVCAEAARVLKFDKTHKWHMGLITLYGSILEYSNAIVVLVDGDSPIGIPIMVRSQLEAFVDLANLERDRSYGHHMDAAHKKEWLKIFREAKSGGNPYLKDISEISNLDQLIAEHQAEIAALEAKGYQALSHFQKFEKSDQAKEYRSLYNFLCCEAHNNIRALYSRHAEISEDRSDFEVQYFAPIDLRAVLQYLDSSLGVLLESTKIIHRSLQSNHLDEVNKLDSQLAVLRAGWMA